MRKSPWRDFKSYYHDNVSAANNGGVSEAKRLFWTKHTNLPASSHFSPATPVSDLNGCIVEMMCKKRALRWNENGIHWTFSEDDDKDFRMREWLLQVCRLTRAGFDACYDATISENEWNRRAEHRQRLLVRRIVLFNSKAKPPVTHLLNVILSMDFVQC